MLGEEGVYRAAENPYVDKTPYGWVVDPTGLRLTLRKLYDRYDLPILITENGYGAPDIVEEDRRINDQDRIDYLAKHILAIQAALTDGVDVLVIYLGQRLMLLVPIKASISVMVLYMLTEPMRILKN